MAQTTYPVPKSNKTLIAAVIGWSLIAGAVLIGSGFYLGIQYQAGQGASKKATVKDALKAVAPAPVVAEASKK